MCSAHGTSLHYITLRIALYNVHCRAYLHLQDAIFVLHTCSFCLFSLSIWPGRGECSWQEEDEEKGGCSFIPEFLPDKWVITHNDRSKVRRTCKSTCMRAQTHKHTYKHTNTHTLTQTHKHQHTNTHPQAMLELFDSNVLTSLYPP